jgi:hypothetical protein
MSTRDIVVAFLTWPIKDILRARLWLRRRTCADCAEFRSWRGWPPECQGRQVCWEWNPLKGFRLVSKPRRSAEDNRDGRCMGFVPKGKGDE